MINSESKTFLEKYNVPTKLVKKISEGSPTILELISNHQIVFIVNTTSGIRSLTDSFQIRKQAVKGRVLHATTIQSASMIVRAINYNAKYPSKIFSNSSCVVL